MLPAVLGDLTRLSRLFLTGNTGLAGSIPRDVMRLALEQIRLDETGLCAPADLEFQLWLSLVSETRVASCVSDPGDLDALVALYLQTDGPNWSNNTNWLTNTPVGRWHGVGTDDTGRVRTLHLEKNNLHGPLPAEIRRLTELRSLFMYKNHLTGPLPPDIGELRFLRILYLSDNQLTGPIPKELGDIEGLSSLYLSNNLFTGAIPPELGRLVGIRNFQLGGNGLTGAIPPELGQLEGADSFDLGRNQLTGPIPSAFETLRNVRLLFLDRNQLTGAIPAELGELVRLENLRLNSNRLSGTVPPELGNLNVLRELDFSNNPALTGQLPRTFLKLTGLVKFGGTGICVPVDSEFHNWLNVGSIDEASRCGDSAIAALTELYDRTGGLNWTNDDNWLSDLPPGDWHGITTDSEGKLTAINLAGNNLSGPLPQILSLLSDLRELTLSKNNGMSGPVPRTYLELNLDVLKLDGTGLCIPADTAFQSWLGAIDDAAAISCDEPDPDREVLVNFYNSTNGANWNNNTNWLSDRPLHEWHGVKTDTEGNVANLGLTDNNLTGSLPPEIGQLDRLLSLTLFNNRLTGRIPTELGRLERLKSLWLGGNELTGPIPPELGRLVDLYWLSLSGNKLTGPIPPELGRLTRLIHLSLSANNLSGAIPPELGQLERLKLLTVSSNRLTGPIPAELSRMSNLEDLILFRNQLSGRIPAELGNMPALKTISLWENRLTGSIPPELGRLDNLIALYLENNQLTGAIPPEIGNLYRLISLSLDHNRLTGAIPPELGQLEGLGNLNLQVNRLSGAIPSELGNMRALKTLNLGENPDLTGPLPLTIAGLGLSNLVVRGTDLCAPPDRAFQEWLDSLPFAQVPDCEPAAGAPVYLVQAVQSLRFSVPLLTGEDALFRLFPSAESVQGAVMPPVRAQFYHGGVQVHEISLPSDGSPLPSDVDEGSLSTSINEVIPGSVIMPGLEMVVETAPAGDQASTAGMPMRIPETGRLAVDVRDVPPLRLTIVPFLWDESPDRSILTEIEGLSADDDLFWQTRNLLPVGDFDVVHREPLWTSVDPVFRNGTKLLYELMAARVMDHGRGHYMGVLRSGGGATLQGGTSFMSGLDGFTIAHELGHNMNLGHTYCGNPPLLTIDANYPYDDGSIGAWGFDVRTGNVVPPETSDLMGYCGPQWISDYNFARALNYRFLQEETGVDAVPLASSHQNLLLWGGVDEFGQAVLEPAFTISAPASLPRQEGPYRLEGSDAGGGNLFTLNFEMEMIMDGEGSAFAFVLPMRPDWMARLDTITLSGPEGEMTIDKAGDRTAALLIDRFTGEARGILRDWGDFGAGSVSGRRALPEGNLEVITSRGVPGAPAAGR